MRHTFSWCLLTSLISCSLQNMHKKKCLDQIDYLLYFLIFLPVKKNGAPLNIQYSKSWDGTFQKSTHWILRVIGFAWKVWSLVAVTLGNAKVYLPDHHLQFSHWHQFFSQKKFVFLLGNTATCCDKFVWLPSFFLIILVIDILEIDKGNCQHFMVQIIFAIKMIKSL